MGRQETYSNWRDGTDAAKLLAVFCSLFLAHTVFVKRNISSTWNLEDVAAFIVTAQNDLSCLSVRKSQQFAVQCWNVYADIF